MDFKSQKSIFCGDGFSGNSVVIFSSIFLGVKIRINFLGPNNNTQLKSSKAVLEKSEKRKTGVLENYVSAD